MPANRASRRREKRLLKNQRLAIFFLPEVFECILHQLPLVSLHSCLLVCRHWNLVVRDVLTRHPASNYGQDPPWLLSCDPLYSSRDNVRAVAHYLRNVWMQGSIPSGKTTIKVVTSKMYERLRYWETYAAACHDLVTELATLAANEEEVSNNIRTCGEGANNSQPHFVQDSIRSPSTFTNGTVPMKATRYQSWSKHSNLRHLTLLGFGFMECLSPIPLINVLGVGATLTSLTLRMSEHIVRHQYQGIVQQRVVSGAELLFTLDSLPNLVHLDIESTDQLEKPDSTSIQYYLGRTFVSLDVLRQKVSGDLDPDANDWDTDEFLLPGTRRRPHGLEQVVREYHGQWLSFVAGGKESSTRFKLRRLRLVDVSITEQHLLRILPCCAYLEELIMDGICWDSTEELALALRKCPRLHTLRLHRVRQSNYLLCTDIIKYLPTLKTLEMDEHDIDLFEYSPRSSVRRGSTNGNYNTNVTATTVDNDNSDDSDEEEVDDGGEYDDGGNTNNNNDGDGGDDDEYDDDLDGDISLRERHERIRFYWKPVLRTNRITSLILTPTAETGRTFGQAHVHTIHCRHVMAIDLHNFLCLAPHLLHLEAPSTLLFEEMILPKKIRSQPCKDSTPLYISAPNTEELVARLLAQTQPPSSWTCHKLRTLKLSIWSEGDDHFLAGCETSRLFGFLAKTCPELEHIALCRKAFALQASLGFGMDELSQLKRLRVLEVSANNLVAFTTADVAWIFDKKQHNNAPTLQRHQHQHQPPPMSPDQEKGGLYGRTMELFRINYTTLLGGKTVSDSKTVNKAYNPHFAFSINHRGKDSVYSDKAK
ncbi:hypothetical protein BGZ73_004178 [Actinomortierella ambigua]|nr:hypothetical protein BGZ73_004178 [Actinomortierella ambigua]